MTFFIVCISREAKRHPRKNKLLFFGFSCALAYALSMSSAGDLIAYHEISLVAGMSAACCAGIAVFAVQNKFDFASIIGVLYTTMIGTLIYVLMLAGMLGQYWPYEEMEVAIGFVTFQAFILAHAFMIMAGRRVQISYEEYVFAAIFIYTDWIVWIRSRVRSFCWGYYDAGSTDYPTS